jgi:uncharacterized protein YkwD
MNSYEQGLFNLTNQRRASQGLPPLQVNPSLVGLARLRSNEMATHNYFSHTSPVTGHDAFSLMDLYGIALNWWRGENLAMNNYPNDQTVAVADEGLWNSPGHRANILNPNYTQIGIGFAVDASGMKYFTILFVGPS